MSSQSLSSNKSSSPGFYTEDNYERATQFLEWVAERVHTTHAYRMVYGLEVQNFYPQAWARCYEPAVHAGVIPEAAGSAASIAPC